MPGVYDIHSPRIPETAEMVELLEKACLVINPEQLWINPDCGLEDPYLGRNAHGLERMVAAARQPADSSGDLGAECGCDSLIHLIDAPEQGTGN